MALNSSDVNAGDDILAADYNLLRQDVREANCDTQTRYYVISPADFAPRNMGGEWNIRPEYLKGACSPAISYYTAGVHLPHGAVITSFKVYWFRDDGAASGDADLFRNELGNANEVTMASADSDVATGYHSVEDTTINNATIDNSGYTYDVEITFNPNDSDDDVWIEGIVITYTIVKSLP